MAVGRGRGGLCPLFSGEERRPAGQTYTCAYMVRPKRMYVNLFIHAFIRRSRGAPRARAPDGVERRARAPGRRWSRRRRPCGMDYTGASEKSVGPRAVDRCASGPTRAGRLGRSGGRSGRLGPGGVIGGGMGWGAIVGGWGGGRGIRPCRASCARGGRPPPRRPRGHAGGVPRPDGGVERRRSRRYLVAPGADAPRGPRGTARGPGPAVVSSHRHCRLPRVWNHFQYSCPI